jgi:hypothetical protein
MSRLQLPSVSFSMLGWDNLFIKQGGLFCFVCHVEMSQNMVLSAMFLVSLKNS